MRPWLAFVVCALLASSLVHAQDDELKIPKAPIPHLRARAHSAAEFAPAGWQVQTQAAGDLNGDGRPDLAFVLQQQNKSLVVSNKGFGVEELNTNPRILAVAFATADGAYALAAQNCELIPRWTEPRMEDWFDEGGSLTVQRGAFSVQLHYFSNAGSWHTGTTTLTFRYQHGRFELIGYEDEDMNRSDLEETSTSVNYSTRLEVTTKAGKTGPVITHKKGIGQKPLLSLDQVGSGLDFLPPWKTYQRSQEP